MNIGVIVDNDLNNDKRVLREIEILKESGHEIFVLCLRFEKKAISTIIGIGITRIKISKRLKNTLFFIQNSFPAYEWFWASHIKTFINKNDIEILHVHDLYMSKAAHSGIEKSRKKIPMHGCLFSIAIS